ncbi:glycerophosphodiester phosphodiesterase [Sarcina ventriculi]|uniref:Glycerophosphoryl diester phosphodiesterase n=1 Tax=Sarcina ventriculi TaxID=1267 RepID=A0ABM9UMK1_SARVE|nr:glycerophosphodiester phosphodiesterase [Sarcina ventriculi]CUN52585.1 Glycerophosphoryl diester phosphodiesterase [Sarcina ventriculi]
MRIFAHRGYSGKYPENTMLAFEGALKLNVNGIELDVHKTKDGKLAAIHDESIDRTFLGNGLVKDYDLRDLKKLENRDEKFRENIDSIIGTLEEVILLVSFKDDFVLNIELKTDVIHYNGIEEDVLEMLDSYDMIENTIISSFNHESLKICKKINKNIKTAALYSEPIEDIVNYAKELGVYAIHPDYKLVDKSLIKKCHENNILVNAYTVNEKEDIERLIEEEIDGIITDYPNIALEILKK